MSLEPASSIPTTCRSCPPSRTSGVATYTSSASIGSSAATAPTPPTSIASQAGYWPIVSGRIRRTGVAYEGKTERHLRLRNDDPETSDDVIAGAFRLAPLAPSSPFYLSAPAGPRSAAFRAAIA